MHKSRKRTTGLIRGNPRLKRLKALVESSPEAIKLVEACFGNRTTVFNYASAADPSWKQDFETELLSRILQFSAENRLLSVGIRHRMKSIWESPSGDGLLDVPLILKEKKALKDTAPHSISFIVPTCGFVGSEASRFVFAPVLVSLVIELSGTSMPFKRNAIVRQSEPSSLSMARPRIADVFIGEPTKDEIATLIKSFLNSPSRLRREFSTTAGASTCPSWRKGRSKRELGLLQMETLLTLKKAFFATGEGEVILSYALVKPTQRAKKAKHDKASLDRADVLRKWWADAFHHKDVRNEPPFVKL